MRATNTGITDSLIWSLNDTYTKMNKYNTQITSGKKIQKPSDDPLGSARVLKLRTSLSQIDQYSKNVDDAKSWLKATDTTLSSISEIIAKCKNIVVAASNQTNQPDDLNNYATQVTQLKEELISLANTDYNGRHIFSGFSTDQNLLNSDGTFAIDVVSINDTINNKTREDIDYDLRLGDSININVLGGDLFNGGNDAVNSNTPSMISDIENLIDALENNNTSELQNCMGSLDTDLKNVLNINADVGARENRLELTSNLLEDDKVSFTELVANSEDTDVAEAITKYQSEQLTYQASLATISKIIVPTLLDFIK